MLTLAMVACQFWCTRDVCSSGLGAVTEADAEASARIDRYFNHIDVRIFIPTGAPFFQ
jgi:hypothetical protein